MRYLLSAFGLSFLVLISGCLPEDEPRELFYEGYDNLYKTIDSQSRTGESVSSEAIWSPPVPPVAYYHGSLISPDRQYVATARDVDGSYDDSDLVIRHVDTGSEAVNTCAESDHYESQVWSQNSAYLAVINQCGSGDELMIIDVQGQVLVPAFIGTGLVWAPDGDNFVYRVGTRYYKNKISSLVPEALSTAGQIVTETPRWSPSGQFVAYVAKITDADEALYVHELATGVTQPVSMHRAIGGVEGFDWSVDSQWLAYIGEASNTEIENGSAIYMVSPQGDQHQIITQVFLHEDSGSLPEVMRLAWSPVQQQLAFTVQSCDGCEYDQQSDLYLVRPDTIAQKVNSHPFVSSYWPEMDLQGRPFSNSLIKSSWSPDGRYLSYIVPDREMITP